MKKKREGIVRGKWLIGARFSQLSQLVSGAENEAKCRSEHEKPQQQQLSAAGTGREGCHTGVALISSLWVERSLASAGKAKLLAKAAVVSVASFQPQMPQLLVYHYGGVYQAKQRQAEHWGDSIAPSNWIRCWPTKC